MSYEIRINGHAQAPHNTIVRQLALDLVEKLRQLEGHQSVNLAGYSSDATGTTDLEYTEPHGAAGQPAVEHTGAMGQTAAPLPSESTTATQPVPSGAPNTPGQEPV